MDTHPHKYQDGYCNHELNNEECGYDGGDCCGNSKKNWDKYCKDWQGNADACACVDPNYCHAENFEELSGNGLCDPELNNAACGYDGGDCCESIHYPQWSNDKYCDDELNNPQCGYDGGDCCNNSNHNWNYYCNDCSCLESQ